MQGKRDQHKLTNLMYWVLLDELYTWPEAQVYQNDKTLKTGLAHLETTR